MTQLTEPRPPKRPRLDLHGVLLLDKPVGLSSNDALMITKRLLWAAKAGHTGTLDPLATGLLPLCFGEATKFSQDLLEADKCYEAQVMLGVTTTTADAEGEILQQRPVHATEEDIHRIAMQFVGEIDQVPPMYSALKKDGKPLYAYARAGQTIERAARHVTIHALEIVDISPGIRRAGQGAAAVEAELPTFVMRVTCSKGTYIRTLAEDIGEALGCGAHLTALRRTAVGDLSLVGAVTLAQLEALEEAERAALLAPVDTLVQTLAQVVLDADESHRFLHGQRLPLLREALPASGVVRVHDAAGCLLGIAELSGPLLRPRRLLHLSRS